MRMFKRLALIVAALVAGCGFLMIFGMDKRGVGSFDQPVIIDSPKPIRRVLYCDGTFDDDIRQQAENDADTRMLGPDDHIDLCTDNRHVLFVGYKAEVVNNQFTAHIKFTTRSGSLRGEQVYHRSHLVIYAEFADGSRACRFVDIPPGIEHEPFVVNMP
ncbi:hypothetical protein [Zavarzinella formosa]|uniref:hypothetical protein n=1 Tax=Zavarzinella formosa TaxID=360055 RepID=UPI00031EA75B|nr:hypothetical protein [Zavarzinella formosa]